MKKIIFWIFILVLFIGCSGLMMFSNKGGYINDTIEEGTVEKTQLKLWFYYEGTERFNKINNLTNYFNQSNDKIVIIPEYIPFDQMKKQLVVGMVANALPDLVIIDNPYHISFSEMGLFADITKQVKAIPGIDEFFEVPMQTVTYNNKIYGLPFAINNVALYYNKKMIENAGVPVPKTWDELRTVSKKLTNKDTKGIGISAPQNEEGVFQYLPWLFSAGGEPTNINSPEAIKSFELLSNLISDGSMSKEVINWTQADLLKQFIEGKTAMMINGSWQVPELQSLAPNLDYGVALIPQDQVHATVLGGENLAVIKGEHVDEAVEFLKFYAQPEVMKSFVKEFGYFPPRKDVADDPTWTKNPIQKVFSENMEYAFLRGPNPNWPRISDVISIALHKSLTHVEELEKITSDAQEEINTFINQKK